jgi:hypothetical protein
MRIKDIEDAAELLNQGLVWIKSNSPEKREVGICAINKTITLLMRAPENFDDDDEQEEPDYKEIFNQVFKEGCFRI